MALLAQNAFSSANNSSASRGLNWSARKLHVCEEIVPAVEDIIHEIESVGFADREIFAIRLALEEALVNAIKHGHKGDSSKEVQLRYHVAADYLLVEIEDQGPGFNPNEVPDPIASENLDRSCGRGLLLMRHYMTWVSFNETGNRVTMCRQR
jgi:serine/threonine-protein kinase RsbW